MLRTDLKWTLQVRKPVKKKPICHWVWLGSARKSALGQLWGRERAPESWTYLQKKKKKTSKDHRLDPQWGRRRVGLPWACEPTAWGVRSEGCASSLHQPRNAEWVLRAPRAPLRPKHRARSAPSSGLRLPLGRAEAHCAALPLPHQDCGRVRSSKTPDVMQARANKQKVSSSSLQERRVKGPTSLEKLCDKLGGSAEWPGLFNRRFLSQEAEPWASSGHPAAPTNSPFAPWLAL